MALGLSRIWDVPPASRMKSLTITLYFQLLLSPTLYILVVANPDSATKITLENVGQAAVEFDRKDFYQ